MTRQCPRCESRDVEPAGRTAGEGPSPVVEHYRCRACDREFGECSLDDRDDTTPGDPFDAVPVVEDPDPDAVDLAWERYGPTAVAGSGPVPDPTHEHRPPVTLEVPDWALQATRWRLAARDDPDPFTVAAILQEYVMPSITFETPEGDDAVEKLLDGRCRGE